MSDVDKEADTATDEKKEDEEEQSTATVEEEQVPETKNSEGKETVMEVFKKFASDGVDWADMMIEEAARNVGRFVFCAFVLAFQELARLKVRKDQIDKAIEDYREPYIIYTSDLSASVTAEDIFYFFGGTDSVSDLYIYDRGKTGDALVEFKSKQALSDALAKHETEFFKKKIKVEYVDACQQICFTIPQPGGARLPNQSMYVSHVFQTKLLIGRRKSCYTAFVRAIYLPLNRVFVILLIFYVFRNTAEGFQNRRGAGGARNQRGGGPIPRHSQYGSQQHGGLQQPKQSNDVRMMRPGGRYGQHGHGQHSSYGEPRNNYGDRSAPKPPPVEPIKSEPKPVVTKDPKSNPFGKATPVDTTAKMREYQDQVDSEKQRVVQVCFDFLLIAPTFLSCYFRTRIVVITSRRYIVEV